VTVLVEEHEMLPDGCCMRFKLAGEPRPVRRVRYESDAAPGAEEWLVEGADGDDSPLVASGVAVEDSGAGLCVLVHGGAHGLRLRASPDGAPLAEPYLLLAPEALLE
jgi:hypothetical protein